MKKAFTLAEVLITLAIIGVVAALTIPSVISNYQQQEFKTGLKKAVSVLNEAIQTNIALEGETPYENGVLYDYLARHMSVIKKMSMMESFPIYKSNNLFYTTDGMRFEFSGSGDYVLHEDGQAHSKFRQEPNGSRYTTSGFCGSYGLKNNPNNTLSSPCMVTVDVNGDKKPNPDTDIKYEYWANGDIMSQSTKDYSYPNPSDKKLTDVFNILITDEKAIPFGVVAQRAMYSSK